ncbi:c-type cytochrome [Altericroceibacterium xinjiangense]|uniref:c-type cytochrome n=1 Tax=Altericroceibacterium xinjiangense TaxID=762261 RepID=UPI000F7ECDC5|nr:c-type cytochrome [Altericroceibacterium xinjiangense]
MKSRITRQVPGRGLGLPGLARAGALTALALVSACKEPPTTRRMPDSAAASRGLALIDKVGCGACHEIPGLDWPKGRLGPSLAGFDDVGLIAGHLPNRPGTLAAFIRNAPAVKPGSTMPPMPLTEEQAADIAAYLYGIDND